MRKVQIFVLAVSLMLCTTGFASTSPAWDVGPPVTVNAVDDYNAPVFDLALPGIVQEINQVSADVGFQDSYTVFEKVEVNYVTTEKPKGSPAFIDRHRRIRDEHNLTIKLPTKNDGIKFIDRHRRQGNA